MGCRRSAGGRLKASISAAPPLKVGDVHTLNAQGNSACLRGIKPSNVGVHGLRCELVTVSAIDCQPAARAKLPALRRSRMILGATLNHTKNALGCSWRLRTRLSLHGLRAEGVLNTDSPCARSRCAAIMTAILDAGAAI